MSTKPRHSAPSQAGRTALAGYLARMGWKAADIARAVRASDTKRSDAAERIRAEIQEKVNPRRR